MLFLLASLFSLAVTEQPVVYSKLGEVRGFQVDTESGGKADIFLGIPFAQPPVDNLRFEKPLPAKPWSTPLNATQWGYECVPHTLHAKNFEVDENCLTINVIRPTGKAPFGGWPVLLWIHGGGYEIGSARLYGYQGFADAFAHREVIIVSIQYRIGIFGFLSNGKKDLPGNLGLWDLSLGLKWVHDNIVLFGGDNTRITPWGLSAGGGAVGQLIISPYSRDYAYAAVEMSGTELVSWAIGVNVVNHSMSLIKELDCLENMKSCLKSKTIKEINEAVERIGYSTADMKIIKWGPRIDGDFIPKHPADLAREAPAKPVIIGVSDKDAGFFTVMNKSRYIQSFQASNNLYGFKKQEMIKRINDLARLSIPFDSEEGYNKILEHYLKGNDKADEAFYLNKYTEFISDTMFNVPAAEAAKVKLQSGWPVYLYRFDHFADAIWEPILAPKGVRGSVHINEFTYMFDVKFLAKWNYSQADIVVKENLRDALASFAKTGQVVLFFRKVFSVPTWNNVEWPKATKNLEFLVMKEHAELQENFMKEATDFWRGLTKQYGFDAITMLPVNERHDEL